MSTNSMPVVLLPIMEEVTKAEIIISLCFFFIFHILLIRASPHTYYIQTEIVV